MMGLLVTAALATPIEHPVDVYRVAVGSDPHQDYDHLLRGADTIGRFVNTAALPSRMGADAWLLLGDLGGDRRSDLNGDRVVDCTVDRVWDGVCEYPSPWSGQLYTDAVATYGAGLPHWVVAGNHDGQPPLPAIPALDEPNEWWRRTVHPLQAEGLTDADQAASHQEVRVDLPSGSWVLLLVHDWSWMQDRAIGGRCDLVGFSGLEHLYSTCSTRGWPNGVISTEQVVWLESRIQAAEDAGHHVLVATHQPPPHTVVLTGAPGEAQAEVCPGIRVHSPVLKNHYPRDADLLPLRTDLDGPGNPREVAHDWASTLLRWEPGQTPDLDWGVDLVRRHPGVVRLWLSGHNHLPIPDLVYAGRGVRYDDAVSGTTWLAHGALTQTWCSTTGACRPQAAVLDLHGDGTWSWERWALQSLANQALPAGCTTSASVPQTLPGPWVGLPIETGP